MARGVWKPQAGFSVAFKLAGFGGGDGISNAFGSFEKAQFLWLLRSREASWWKKPQIERKHICCVDARKQAHGGDLIWSHGDKASSLCFIDPKVGLTNVFTCSHRFTDCIYSCKKKKKKRLCDPGLAVDVLHLLHLPHYSPSTDNSSWNISDMFSLNTSLISCFFFSLLITFRY